MIPQKNWGLILLQNTFGPDKTQTQLTLAQTQRTIMLKQV